jgi:hypothetical protein
VRYQGGGGRPLCDVPDTTNAVGQEPDAYGQSAKAPPGTAPDRRHDGREDIRIAIVLNGGVSPIRREGAEAGERTRIIGAHRDLQETTETKQAPRPETPRRNP